jgi:hypothetical protein
MPQPGSRGKQSSRCVFRTTGLRSSRHSCRRCRRRCRGSTSTPPSSPPPSSPSPRAPPSPRPKASRPRSVSRRATIAPQSPPRRRGRNSTRQRRNSRLLHLLTVRTFKLLLHRQRRSLDGRSGFLSRGNRRRLKDWSASLRSELRSNER